MWCRVKSGGENSILWLIKLLNVYFIVGKVSKDWTCAYVDPLWKAKRIDGKCSNFRNTSLLGMWERCVVGC